MSGPRSTEHPATPATALVDAAVRTLEPLLKGPVEAALILGTGLGGLADLALLSRGDIFLGAFSSHFSKVAYYSMVGQHLRVLPFMSLDYPLDCDTTDSCTPQDIEARHPTMEDLATWAPECLRGKLPWSPGENSDPCGVYI